MNPELWAKAEAIYHAAETVDPTDLDTFLDEQCGNDEELRALVERLLQGTDQGMDSFLEPGSVGPQYGHYEEGSRIGQFQPIRKIGRGSMGTVFLARQEEP